MNTLFVLDRQNYDPEWPVECRRAVRAIIERKGKLALARSKKYGDIKFPGGGMEDGETPFDTLIREVREETGLSVISETIKKFGKTLEIRKSFNEDHIFHQTSLYYRCEIAEGIGETDLDDYEREYGYQLIFMSAAEAHAHNRNLPIFAETPWIQRETKILALLAGLD